MDHATAGGQRERRAPVHDPMPAQCAAPIDRLGNQEMQRLLRSDAVGAAREVGASDAPEEREADAIADRVIRDPDGGAAPAGGFAPDRAPGMLRRMR